MFQLFPETMLFSILAIKTVKNVTQITLPGLIFSKVIGFIRFTSVLKSPFLFHYFLN